MNDLPPNDRATRLLECVMHTFTPERIREVAKAFAELSAVSDPETFARFLAAEKQKIDVQGNIDLAKIRPMAT